MRGIKKIREEEKQNPDSQWKRDTKTFKRDEDEDQRGGFKWNFKAD